MKSVYSAVRTGDLNVIQVYFRLEIKKLPILIKVSCVPVKVKRMLTDEFSSLLKMTQPLITTVYFTHKHISVTNFKSVPFASRSMNVFKEIVRSVTEIVLHFIPI